MINPRSFEAGPIRPPNEATSLLVRVTRNCPWNRCAFCPVYKGSKFSLRTVEEIKADIDAMANQIQYIKDLSEELGAGGAINHLVLQKLANEDLFGGTSQLVLFLRGQGQTAFLQDANSLIMPVDQLVDVLQHLRERFPSIKRITSYARSHTIIKRSIEDLTRLQQAGLDRIHIGLESGSDRVLELIEKGVTADRHIEAGHRIKEAGMELSEYIMPGLGGKALSEEHANETARVLRAIDPHFIRLRSLAIAPQTPLADKRDKGEFEPLNDIEVAKELRLLLLGFNNMTSSVHSDHILNLLEEIEGKLPDDQSRMLATVERFLNMDPHDQELFIVGRRLGRFHRLDDLENPIARANAQHAHDEIRQHFPGPIHKAILQIMTEFIS